MTLVVATDFSPEAQRAAAVGARMAARAGGGLTLVHVSTDPRAPLVLGTAEERLLATERGALSEAADALRAGWGVEVEEELCAGPVADGIAGAAERVVAEAILVGGGARRRSGEGMVERLARQARAPVLVVRDPGRFEAWLDGERPLRVMVGSDLGLASTRALRFAADLGRLGAVEVTVASFAAPEEASLGRGLPLPEHTAALLPAAEAALRRDLADQIRQAPLPGELRIVVQARSAAPEIHLAVLAEQDGVDLLVVGARHQSWIEQVWSGSVSRGLLRAASTNVAAVPRTLIEERPAAPPVIRSVVAATDLSPLGDAAVWFAFGLVPAGGTVHLAHVVGAGQRRHEIALRYRLTERVPADAAGRRIGAEAHVLVGRPAEQVVALGERVGADAICVGSHGRSGIGAALLGSVSREILARSRRPVLVVPAPRE